MERRLFQAVVGLAWLALPLTALNFSRAWDRLPMRIAVHFDANWQPNGWTTREGSRTLALGMTAFLLVVFTIASYAARSRTPLSLAPWALVVVFYVVLGVVYYVNTWIVERNFQPRPRPFAELTGPRDLDAGGGFPQGLKPIISAHRAGQLEAATFQDKFFRDEFSQYDFPHANFVKTSLLRMEL
jgi:hypothetical protein